MSSHFADKFPSGNRNPLGDGIEAEEQAAAGRRQRPEAVTEQRAGYETADDPNTKILFDSSRPNVQALLVPGPKPRHRDAPSHVLERLIAPAHCIRRAPAATAIHSDRIGRTESPEPAYATSLYLAPTGHFLERLGMNAEKSSGFGGIKQRFEFSNREPNQVRWIFGIVGEGTRHEDLQCGDHGRFYAPCPSRNRPLLMQISH